MIDDEDDLRPTVEITVDSGPVLPPDVMLILPPAATHSVLTEETRESCETDRDVAILDALRDMQAALVRRLDGLQTLFEREARAEVNREKIIDRLHAELQEYKNDLLLNTLRPVFLDLIQLHDNMGKVIEAQSAGAADDRLVEITRGFQQDIEDLLYRQGVEPFAVEGDVFDPRRQRAVATVATDDPDRVRTVAARIRQGFAAGEKVLRPELVTVYTLAK